MYASSLYTYATEIDTAMSVELLKMIADVDDECP
jgi:hypothetical protein